MTEDPLPEKARAERLIRIGQPPRDRGELLRKLVWILPWLVFLGAPVQDLLADHHTTAATTVYWVGLLAFTGIYLAVVFRTMGRPPTPAGSSVPWSPCCGSWPSPWPSASAIPGSASSCTSPSPAG